MIELTFKDKKQVVNEAYILNNGLNKWQGWNCFLASYYLRINNKGDVHWGNCPQAIYLGNFLQDSFDIHKRIDPILCEQSECSCFSGLALRKFTSDPTQYLKEVKPVNTQEDLNIFWMLDSKCNFECWYCADHLHSKEFYKNIDQIKIIKDNILRVARKHKSFINIGGGEPTILNELPKWCAEFKEEGSRVMVTTNGSRSLKYLIELSKHAEIVFSVHMHQAKLLKLAEKINKLSYQNYLPFQVQIPCAPQELINLKNLLETFDKGKFSIQVQKLFFKDGITMPYSERQDQLINNINKTFTF
jgi:organic radical activating enzyme